MIVSGPLGVQPRAARIFISYKRDTEPDEGLAMELWQRLTDAGHHVFLDVRELRPGDRWGNEVDDEIREADCLIVLLTPASIASSLVRGEVSKAVAKARSGGRPRIVPVRVASFGELPYPLSAHLDELQWAEWNADTPQLAESLLSVIASDNRVRPSSRRIDNLSPRNPHFTGRSELLSALHAALTAPGASDIRTAVVYGHPGVGTTELALEYAHQRAADFDVIWWIDAETSTAIPAAFERLGGQLNTAGHGASSTDQQTIVESVLDDLAGRARWLIVFDHARNLDAVAPFLPGKGSGRILITSRNPDWQRRVTATIKVDVFTPDEAVDFLLRRTTSTDRDSAADVAEVLGWLPLALEQAAAYMTATSKLLADYLSLLRRRRDDLLSLAQSDGSERTVGTVVGFALDELRKSPAETQLSPAETLLTWCAFMGADGIPLDLLTGSRPEDVPEDLRPLGDEIALDRAVGVLHAASLATRRGGVLGVHRLVQAVVRARLLTERRKWAGTAVQLLTAAFPSDLVELASPNRWAWCEQLLPHVYAASDRCKEAHAGAAPAQLLMHLGSYLQHRGEYGEAAGLFRTSLGLVEEAYGPDDPRLAQPLNALGYVLRIQGNIHGARAAHERALGLLQDAGRTAGLELAMTLNNLGRVLYEQRDVNGARTLFDRALTIVEAAPAGQPEEASVRNNIARIFYDQGQFDEAQRAYERALGIKEKAAGFGPEHPSVAATLASLGRVFIARNDLRQARQALERARKIQETALRAHPDLVTTLGDLASVLETLGVVDAAAAVRARATEVSQELLSRPRRRLEVD